MVPHVGLTDTHPPLGPSSLFHFWPWIFHSIFLYSGRPLILERAGGQEPAAGPLSGGAMYHPAPALYLSSSAPSPRNLGSELPCITPLSGSLLPCITAPIGPKVPRHTTIMEAHQEGMMGESFIEDAMKSKPDTILRTSGINTPSTLSWK